MNCKINVELIPDASEIAEARPDMCVVDWARKAVETARHENCGKSVMCRDGITQLAAIIGDIVSGRGQPDDLALLRELSEVIATTGGCALAEKAARDVLDSLDRYAEEWDLHCRRKRCTNLICKSYFGVYCAPEKCQGCTACMKVCPAGAISGGPGMICVVDTDKCVRCGKCFEVCPHEARAKFGAVKPKLPEAPVPVGSFAGAAGGAGRRSRRRNLS